MKLNPPIGIALLSFAHAHQEHWAKAVAADPRAHLSVVWDEDPDRGSAAAQRHGTRYLGDLGRVLRDPTVHAVAICAENHKHAELVELVAAAGKHILCEKPTARSLAECQRMAEAVARGGVLYMQSFPQRLLPANQRVKALLVEGAIGAISLVRKRHGHDFALRDLDTTMPWILDPERGGGGALLDEGVHQADMLRWLFGDPEEVTSLPGRMCGGRRVEDTGAAIYRFANGILGVLEAGWTWVAGGPTTEIYGDRGVIVQGFTDCASSAAPLPGAAYLRLYRADVPHPAWVDLGCEHDFRTIHRRVPHAFLDCLTSGDLPPSTLTDGAAALEMILGAYHAAADGRTVRFPLPGGLLRPHRE
jgi:myo-inositol 2-dehydrogenase/D-chiro-inositol 1-dehydrogenase